jgi:hypothetical protein
MRQVQEIRNKIRSRLIADGTNLNKWARDHGFIHGSVSSVISRYAGGGKMPNGHLEVKIIKALEADTGVKICEDLISSPPKPPGAERRTA